MDISLPQFCMKDFDFILEVSDINKYQKQENGFVIWLNKGCSFEGCCGISAAIEGTARRNSAHSNCCSHDCSCHAITQMPHLPCGLQDTLFLTGNQFQWLPEKKKSISTATCLPACANQIFLYKLSKTFTNLQLSLSSHVPSIQLIKTKQCGYLHHLRFTPFFQRFSTAQEPPSLDFSPRHSCISTQIISELASLSGLPQFRPVRIILLEITKR